MAKELIFKLNGTDYGSAPVKLERKKIYGWTDYLSKHPTFTGIRIVRLRNL